MAMILMSMNAMQMAVLAGAAAMIAAGVVFPKILESEAWRSKGFDKRKKADGPPKGSRAIMDRPTGDEPPDRAEGIEESASATRSGPIRIRTEKPQSNEMPQQRPQTPIADEAARDESSAAPGAADPEKPAAVGPQKPQQRLDAFLKSEKNGQDREDEEDEEDSVLLQPAKSARAEPPTEQSEPEDGESESLIPGTGLKAPEEPPQAREERDRDRLLLSRLSKERAIGALPEASFENVTIGPAEPPSRPPSKTASTEARVDQAIARAIPLDADPIVPQDIPISIPRIETELGRRYQSDESPEEGPTDFSGMGSVGDEERRRLIQEIDDEIIQMRAQKEEREKKKVIEQSERSGAHACRWPTFMGDDAQGLEAPERARLIRMLRDLHDPRWCLELLVEAFQEEKPEELRPAVLEAIVHSYHGESLKALYEFAAEEGSEDERRIASDALARLAA